MSVVSRVLGLQVAVTTVVAAMLLMFQGATAALAAVIGGMIGITGGWVYARKMTIARDAGPAAMMGAQYRAEAYKLATTVVLFASTFVLYREISPIPFFLTYLATLLVYWVALLFR